MAMEFLLVLILAFAIVCGLPGAIIASSKGASGFAGFLLGTFFGPIGLIIAALLGPSVRSEPLSNNSRSNAKASNLEPEPAANLESDEYKIWLAKKYNIERNELFNGFSVNNKLYATLNEALEAAHASDLESRIEKARIKELQEINSEIEAKKFAENQIKTDKFFRYISYIIVFCVIFYIFWMFISK